MIARVCQATRDSGVADRVVVAWAHKFAQYDENDVLARFRHVVLDYKPDVVIRITSDCPLLRPFDIINAYREFVSLNTDYYSNHDDGHDVQIFKPELLWTRGVCDKEHVISDFTTVSNGMSVNTPEDLERVRRVCKEK